jgi:hypothetical protein
MARTRTWGLGSILGFFLSVAVATAAQTGVPAAPVGAQGAAVSVSVGYAERDLDGRGNDRASSLATRLTGAFGLTDEITLYGRAGAADLRFRDEGFDGSRGADLGLGVRYAMLTFPQSRTKLVLDLEAGMLRVTDEGHTVRAQEYHAATYVVKEVAPGGGAGTLFPYGGFRASFARYRGGGFGTRRLENHVGAFVGADYFMTPNVYFSGAVHLFDETSLALAVGYRF